MQSASSHHLNAFPFHHHRRRRRCRLQPCRQLYPRICASSSPLPHLVRGAGDDDKRFSSDLLPVVVHKSGRAYRYAWDGARLAMVPCDCGETESADRFGEVVRLYCSAVNRLFVPHNVQNNYFSYLKWKLIHRIFSSALQVLATQALFRAIGFGSSRALSSAAALNWMLKDGVGRLSRCIYTASIGAAFDTNLKWVRFSTSVLFSLSVGLELMTPVFPQHFLLLATIANIAKSISLASYIATGSAIHRSFAVGDNLGEVSAKAQVQTVCFDMVGLLLAATLNHFCKNCQRFQEALPFFVYPIFSAVDLFGIYQALKHVHLQTLTKDRLEIIIDRWIHTGLVPSPADVSKIEGIFPIKGNKSWPVRIGAVNPRDLFPEISILTMKLLKEEAHFFICIETYGHLIPRHRQHGLVLSLREDAGTADIIAGLLQVCHARRLLLTYRSKREHMGSCSALTTHWFGIAENSKKCALEDVDQLIVDIQRGGWAVKNVLLTSQEQIRYSLVKE